MEGSAIKGFKKAMNDDTSAAQKMATEDKPAGQVTHKE